MMQPSIPTSSTPTSHSDITPARSNARSNETSEASRGAFKRIMERESVNSTSSNRQNEGTRKNTAGVKVNESHERHDASSSRDITKTNRSPDETSKSSRASREDTDSSKKPKVTDPTSPSDPGTNEKPNIDANNSDDIAASVNSGTGTPSPTNVALPSTIGNATNTSEVANSFIAATLSSPLEANGTSLSPTPTPTPTPTPANAIPSTIATTALANSAIAATATLTPTAETLPVQASANRVLGATSADASMPQTLSPESSTPFQTVSTDSDKPLQQSLSTSIGPSVENANAHAKSIDGTPSRNSSTAHAHLSTPQPFSPDHESLTNPATGQPIGHSASFHASDIAKAHASPQSALHNAALATPSEAAKQLVHVVRPLKHNADGNYQLTLQLRPEELGRVEIAVTLKAGELSMQLSADNASARDLLKQSLNELRGSLESAGLSTGELDVSSGERNNLAESDIYTPDFAENVDENEEDFFLKGLASAVSEPLSDGSLDVHV